MIDVPLIGIDTDQRHFDRAGSGGRPGGLGRMTRVLGAIWLWGHLDEVVIVVGR